jgi:hypothetical protein
VVRNMLINAPDALREGTGSVYGMIAGAARLKR